MERFWSYAAMGVVFLLLGVGGVLAYQSLTKSESQVSAVATPSLQPATKTETPVSSPEPEESTLAVTPSSIGGSSQVGGGGKFIIVETQKIYADRYTVQTGETVNFFTKLKHMGTSKKFVTHICFQYSGGNFGCHLNTNFAPGEEKSIHNGMVFPHSGTYTVWVTWSQDKTNFYVPQNAGQVTVTVY